MCQCCRCEGRTLSANLSIFFLFFYSFVSQNPHLTWMWCTKNLCMLHSTVREQKRERKKRNQQLKEKEDTKIEHVLPICISKSCAQEARANRNTHSLTHANCFGDIEPMKMASGEFFVSKYTPPNYISIMYVYRSSWCSLLLRRYTTFRYFCRLNSTLLDSTRPNQLIYLWQNTLLLPECLSRTQNVCTKIRQTSNVERQNNMNTAYSIINNNK